MLIKNAQINRRRVDLRVGQTVDAVATELAAQPGEAEIDVGGGEVLPGLHDHHIHVFAAAASYESVDCNVGAASQGHCRSELEARLKAASGDGWIRGVDYQEQQLGDLDRWALDELCDSRPIRIQHRSGKIWVCNSLALNELGLSDSDQIDGVERSKSGVLSGRIIRNDGLILQRMRAAKATYQPDIGAFSRQLASLGIVGVTDTSARNNLDTLANFEQMRCNGVLLQRVSLMGGDCLDSGYLKILLDDDRLPPLEQLVTRINAARSKGRNVAFHCVTHLELVFAIAALEEAAPCEFGFDRIEHGAVVNDEMACRLADLGLPVVTQPGFLFSKGDQYLDDLSEIEVRDLYRFAALQRQGVCVVASSDAPYGPLDPWQVIGCAATRRTRAGAIVGEQECVSAAEALSGYLTPMNALNQDLSFADAREIRIGMPADLCVLHQAWSERALFEGGYRGQVRATLIGGSVAFDSESVKES